MSFDTEPTPEPRGDLSPPPRRPPTAVATSTPPPPPRAPRPAMARERRGSWLLQAAGRALTMALDAADRVGDTIREALGAPPARPPGGEVASRGPGDTA